MKRYQESNWIVKLWRRRHYVYIPFKFVYIKWEHKALGEFTDDRLWSLLVGSAQCDMNWTYTAEEATEMVNKTIDRKDPSKDMKVLDENGNNHIYLYGLDGETLMVSIDDEGKITKTRNDGNELR